MTKILIVDDDNVQRGIYDAVFLDAKFDVVTAIDGQDGWEKFEKEKPDVVFTGIMMLRMTGFELIEKVQDKSKNIPVIIFSHLGRDEDREKAAKKNIAFMVKGLDSPRKILEHVKDALK